MRSTYTPPPMVAPVDGETANQGRRHQWIARQPVNDILRQIVEPERNNLRGCSILR
jgi:hypothetical protein